jgi:polyether ionophore transport system permease protein
MAANAGAPRHPAAATFRPSALSRLYGFGSIYAKTMRDSRLAFIIAAGLLGGLSLAMGAAIPTVFPTDASRLEIDKLIGGMPSQMVDFFGKPVGLGTFGGYLSWKYGLVFVLATSLWSILALSGTLAGEAGRGSLDIIATSPFGKRRIAIEKLAAHLTGLFVALAFMTVMITISSNTYGNAALGDRLSAQESIGFALWLGFPALFFGGLAFALGPFLGRGGSAGVAGIALAAAWSVNGLHLDPLTVLSPFSWMSNHVPLAGSFDWPGLALVGVAAVVLLALGVEAFARHDLGITLGLGLPTLPASVLGVRGPISRAFGDQLPRALAWGLGLGVFGAMLSSLVGEMTGQLTGDTNLIKVLQTAFPGLDLTTAGGFLQLFIELFYIVAGFAAATFVSKWASDETADRLEEVLATPLPRWRWVVAGGIAALGAVAVMTLLFALSIGLGASAGGVALGDAVLGSASLGLYAAALIGIGVAVGGLWRTSLAAELVALFVVVTYLVGLLAPPLGLPDWFHQLALTTHFGQPMAGQWDVVGVVACVVIAVGGIALGAWGMTRRDVAS